jgi:hypothetical protein
MTAENTQLPVGCGKFAKPVEMTGVKFSHFQLRESTVDDMLEVELQLSQTGRGTNTPIAFNGEMMMRQMVKVYNPDGKEFTGPFTMNMLKMFGPRNYRAIREVQLEIDILGEAE